MQVHRARASAPLTIRPANPAIWSRGWLVHRGLRPDAPGLVSYFTFDGDAAQPPRDETGRNPELEIDPDDHTVHPDAQARFGAEQARAAPPVSDSKAAHRRGE